MKKHKAATQTTGFFPPSWWTLSVGTKVIYKGLLVTVSYIGRNQGPDTVVRIIIPNKVKAKAVRMRELSWDKEE